MSHISHLKVDPDLELGSPSVVGGNVANDKSIRPVLSEMTSNTTLSVPQVVNTIPRPLVEQHAGLEGSDSGNAPTQAGQGGDAQAPQKQEVDHVPQSSTPPAATSGHRNDHSGPGREGKMIGDFDGSANALWELYVKEAKGNDESQIQSLNEDMGGVLVFAGLFSTVLTAFIIDSKDNLKVNPQDQMVYYLQQNVALLDQISKQILSIAPQVSIPSTPPPPFPSFKPLESDIRVNVFWFMALIFSLAAALLAILMQQWVRNYMHVFQRYSDPLKCARVRQYLHDGLERGWMPGVAEAVPGFLHVSLFLFFVGLCDFVLNIDTTIGIYTTVPIAITGLLYISATFFPFFRPQSPYQTWFSTIFSVAIWYPKKIWDDLRYKDRGSDGAKKPVRQNMSQIRMQLAMKETDQRKGRDVDAIRWLTRDMTGDSEMESLVLAIPGSFNCKWGMEVWENVSKPLVDDPHTDPMVSLHELTARASRILETCKNRGPSDSDVWQKRTRGCVETTALFVICMGGNRDPFADIVMPLGDIGSDQNVRELSSAGKDEMFVMRWTCLSLVAVQPKLASNRNLRNHARLAMSSLTEGQHHTDERQTPTSIIGTFNIALECLEELYGALRLWGGIEEEEAKNILHHCRSPISKLAGIGGQYSDSADTWIQAVQCDVVKTTHRIICQLPGIEFDDPDAKVTHLSQLKESYRDPHKLQLITLSHRLRRIHQVAQTFRDLLCGQWSTVTFEESINDLQRVLSLLKDAPLHREVWRLQDLCEGRGLGFTVELFLLALKQLLSTSSSKESHSALLMGAFQAITSDSSKYKSPLGTQQLLLGCVVSNNDIVFGSTDTIIDEFFSLLATVLKGQSGSHVEDIVQLLTEKLGSRLIPKRRAFYRKALEVINEAKASSPPS